MPFLANPGKAFLRSAAFSIGAHCFDFVSPAIGSGVDCGVHVVAIDSYPSGGSSAKTTTIERQGLGAVKWRRTCETAVLRCVVRQVAMHLASPGR